MTTAAIADDDLAIALHCALLFPILPSNATATR